ncbi:hypothetical protein SDC9_79243 [bioreactor metagenome]|uniref:NAD-specific glutamate dehydrogenase n=1 Tax=bioreactor metagenome TaxID=1076179 RepID=A0A644YXD7_9ZZZZ
MLAAALACAVEVVLQHGAVVRVCALVDDDLGALAWREAAQIGQALFGDDDLRVVLGVIDVRAHGHDAADLAVLGDGGRHEEVQEGVAGKVARTADAVHHARAHHVGGVDVAVDVGLDHRVHADDAQAAHHFGVVADLLRAQHDAVAVVVDVFVEVFQGGRAQRDGTGRGRLHLAGAQQVEHAVLQHFGVARQILEGAVQQASQHGVGDVAHARLQRQQVLGQAAHLHLMGEEVDDVLGDALGVRVGRGERGVAVGLVGLDDGDHLGGVAHQVRRADAVMRATQRDWLAVRRHGRAIVDVVHAVEFQRQAVVDFQDHLVGQIQPRLVVADRHGGHEAAVGVDGGDLDDRDVQVAEEAEPGVLCHVRQVHVGKVHGAGIDLFAADRVGLEGQTHLDAVHLGERAVQFRGGGGAGPDVHAKCVAFGVFRFDAFGQRLRNRLGIA